GRQRLRLGAVPDRARRAGPRALRGAQRRVLQAISGRRAGHTRVPRFPAGAARAPAARRARRLAPRLHARARRSHDPARGARADRAPPRARRRLRHPHLDQRLHHRADRARARRRAPARDRARDLRRGLHRPPGRHPVLPRGQDRAARALARLPRRDARLVREELVLQRLAERPAAARARHRSRRRRPRRDAAPRRARARLAGDHSEMRALPAAIVVLVPVALGLAIALGSVPMSAGQLAQALAGRGDDALREIVWDVRVPRALAAFACGALLALSGALLQVLLRNPLADPYILGVSGGASVGALLALVLGLAATAMRLFALAGAALAAGAVFAFSRGRAGWNPYRVLLTGVALSAGCGAIVGLLL